MINETEAIDPKYFGCKLLEDILNYAPICVVYNNKQYSFVIRRGNNGFVVYYVNGSDQMHIGAEGIKFTRETYLFNTSRRSYKLMDAVASILKLLYDHREELYFIPTIHPFNQKKEETT